METYTQGQVFFGIKTGFNEAFLVDEGTKDILLSNSKNQDLLKPFVVGDDVRKYTINFKNKYLIRIPKGWTNANRGKIDAWTWFKKSYPEIANHLGKHETNARKRQDQGEYWWELRACDYYDKFDMPKIVYPDIAKESRVAFDAKGLYFSNTVYFIPLDDKYLLGILNSKLIFAYFKRIASVLGDADKGGRLRWFRQDVFKLPIRPINFSDPAEKATHDQMVTLVERMLGLTPLLSPRQAGGSQARTPQEREAIERQIEATDRAIDRLVYELYGLSKEEIAIVEGG